MGYGLKLVSTKGIGARKMESQEDERWKRETRDMTSLLARLSAPEQDTVLDG